MSGEIALDTSVAIRFLNGDAAITEARGDDLPQVQVRLLPIGSMELVIKLRDLCYPSGTPRANAAALRYRFSKTYVR
jgi:hypothetical protein